MLPGRLRAASFHPLVSQPSPEPSWHSGLSRSCLVVPREIPPCPQDRRGCWGMFPTAPPCHLLQVSLTVKDCAPAFPLLPPAVVALPEKVPPVTFYLSVCLFVHLLPPSRWLVLQFFVVANNHLICFPVILPLKANHVLTGILFPSLFPLQVIFYHYRYPPITFPLSVFFLPVTISFTMIFLPFWSYFPVIKTFLVTSPNTLSFPHTPFLCRLTCCLPHFVFKSSSCIFEEKGV